MKCTLKTLAIRFVLAACLAGAAAAQTPGAIRVSYGDLDLSRPAAAKVMLHRIEHAAFQACGLQDAIAPFKVQICRHEAVADAVNRLNAPLVTLAWRGDADVRLASK